MGASAYVSPLLPGWWNRSLALLGPLPQTSANQLRSCGLPARMPAARRASATQRERSPTTMLVASGHTSSGSRVHQVPHTNENRSENSPREQKDTKIFFMYE